MRELKVSIWLGFLPYCLQAVTPIRSQFQQLGKKVAPVQPVFQIDDPEGLQLEPAKFKLTEAQGGQCSAPMMPAMSMYLTALGASALGGQWGSWQLTDSPEAPSTASWRLNFMSADWRTMRISADGNLSAIAKPMEIEELKTEHNWVPEDSSFGFNRWAFVEDLLAPGVAMKYDGLNYTVGKDPESFPVTYTASPQLTEAAMAVPTWQYWSITDCNKQLVAVVATEETDGMRPGRCKVYNAQGQKATEAIPDALMPRLQFVDINQHLLATAEAPTLGSNIPMPQVPRRASLGNILPYSIRFERGGYDFSSDLLKKDFRWILSAAVQLRSLDDASQGFIPLFVKDKYLLLSVALALGLIFIVIFGTMFVSSVRTASRIFFHRDKQPDSTLTAFP